MRKLQLFLSEFDKNSVEFTEITSLKDYFLFFTLKMTGIARNVEYNFLDILLSLEFTTCGGVLSFMVILSFMVHHMLRVNISIAIVEMAVKNVSNRSENYGPRYDWSAIEKNYILGSYFWGYIITQIPGGRLAERFGSKIVVGVGLLSASVLTLLIPAASNIHYYLVLLIRVCLGLTMGVHWPSIPPMAVKWSPPNDISKFMSHMFASALGAGATVVLCGYLIVYFGWPSVFYVTGTLGLLWALAWFYLVYDSPGQHPRISIVEKEKLENKIQNKSHLVKKQKTPWRKIFTSTPVWAIVVSNPCGLLGTLFVLQHLPTYLDQVLHFNIKQNGWISSLPHLGKYPLKIYRHVSTC
jgi:ACS family sodium-dependent inorganic phosphate cotransporter